MYLLSLSMNGMYANGVATSGLNILWLGWLGIIDGVVAWYANPCLLLSFVLLLKLPDASGKFALLGFCLGASALSIQHMVVDESGNQVAVTLGAAYYLWLACFPVAYLASVSELGG